MPLIERNQNQDAVYCGHGTGCFKEIPKSLWKYLSLSQAQRNSTLLPPVCELHGTLLSFRPLFLCLLSHPLKYCSYQVGGWQLPQRTLPIRDKKVNLVHGQASSILQWITCKFVFGNFKLRLLHKPTPDTHRLDANVIQGLQITPFSLSPHTIQKTF